MFPMEQNFPTLPELLLVLALLFFIKVLHKLMWTWVSEKVGIYRNRYLERFICSQCGHQMQLAAGCWLSLERTLSLCVVHGSPSLVPRLSPRTGSDGKLGGAWERGYRFPNCRMHMMAAASDAKTPTVAHSTETVCSGANSRKIHTGRLTNPIHICTNTKVFQSRMIWKTL